MGSHISYPFSTSSIEKDESGSSSSISKNSSNKEEVAQDPGIPTWLETISASPTISGESGISCPTITNHLGDCLGVSAFTENGAKAYSAFGVGEDARTRNYNSHPAHIVSFYTSLIGSREGSSGMTRESLCKNIAMMLEEVKMFEDKNIEESRLCLEDLFVLMANTRDIRHGKGERDLAYWFMIEMRHRFPKEVDTLLPLLTFDIYGSFLDLPKLWTMCMTEHNTDFADVILDLYVICLRTDMEKISEWEKLSDSSSSSPSLTLAWKWAPSEKSKYKAMHIALCEALFPETENVHTRSRSFRLVKSAANRHLSTLETLMSSKEELWDRICVDKIPSKALHRYRTALRNIKIGPYGEEMQRSLRPDRIACAEHFEEAIMNQTKNPTKSILKTNVIDPYVMVKSAFFYNDDMVNAQWVSKLAGMDWDSLTSLRPIAITDVSLSMEGTPMIAAIALSMIVQHIPGPFQHRLITFHSVPSWIHVPHDEDDTLFSQVQAIKSAGWGGSTNFHATMKLILDFAVANKLTPEDMPGALFCFTDMQFDSAGDYCYPYNETNSTWKSDLEDIQTQWSAHGYTPPQIILWNLRASGTGSFQAQSNTPGVSMVSGWSEKAFNAFCQADVASLKPPTPYETIRTVLDDAYYYPVRKVLRTTYT